MTGPDPTEEELAKHGYHIKPDTLSTAYVLHRPGDQSHVLSFEREALLEVARESWRRGLISG
jgi:hypothetical protein